MGVYSYIEIDEICLFFRQTFLLNIEVPRINEIDLFCQNFLLYKEASEVDEIGLFFCQKFLL